ncbi:uncharacterized protein FA14DRAFT_154555 [Meira miltonrushii]|uniref:Hydrophobin n=1 Tax=Meira miltonrushii TaxID=1280837 RepID=A0A316VBX2_9BASI|nr:uncharacterized protein FA14DRAFT_154555 [Meira miltonrushii]PWN35129.1 hypothetical protein FA14DRAFT_154555 [Meira miltonrushii]
MRFNIASFVLLASFVVAINAKNDINRVRIARRSDLGSQRSNLLPRQDDPSTSSTAAPATSATDGATDAASGAASDATSAASSAASSAAGDAAAAAPPTPKWNPSASADCTYNSDGCLTQASAHGCPIQIQPPSNGKGTTCSTGGGNNRKRLFSFPNQLLNLDILNCDTLCILSDCPAQQSCSVQSSDGSFINVQALNCDNLYILSSASK